MNTIVWSEKYSVGVSELDEQHKRIIKLIQRLTECKEKEERYEIVADVLNEMHSYIIEHFGCEEALLSKRRYPDLAGQKTSHNKFIKHFSYICAEVDHSNKDSIKELLNYLNEWWDTHILQDDMRYKKYLS